MRGTYALILRASRPATLNVGSLGALNLVSGIYIYVGSGLGQYSASVEGRIKRHLGARHRPHWHIDYVLESQHMTPLGAIFAPSKRSTECRLNKELLQGLSARQPYPGFGSSDCTCRSHLLFLKHQKLDAVLESIQQAYESLGLRPRTVLF